ncbi:MAG: hypothetical protein ACKVPX_09415 [Myxococcaceae bacterium]
MTPAARHPFLATQRKDAWWIPQASKVAFLQSHPLPPAEVRGWVAAKIRFTQVNTAVRRPTGLDEKLDAIKASTLPAADRPIPDCCARSPLVGGTLAQSVDEEERVRRALPTSNGLREQRRLHNVRCVLGDVLCKPLAGVDGNRRDGGGVHVGSPET